jgi:hypothetical protein
MAIQWMVYWWVLVHCGQFLWGAFTFEPAFFCFGPFFIGELLSINENSNNNNSKNGHNLEGFSDPK